MIHLKLRCSKAEREEKNTCRHVSIILYFRLKISSLKTTSCNLLFARTKEKPKVDVRKREQMISITNHD